MLSHEVIIGNSTFIVNSFSRKGATETPEQLLKRVIVSNAEKEFKTSLTLGTTSENNYNRKTA